MTEYQVTCITKPHPESRYEHITHVGNSQGNWRMTREAVIRRIEGGNETYVVIDRSTGKRALIGVRHDTGKAPYLQTQADGYWNDNLLALPQCGALPVIE
jgi:hypothetical protein